MKVERKVALALAREALEAVAGPGDGTLVERLAKICFHAVVAGSLRRGAAEVGDVELMLHHPETAGCPVTARLDAFAAAKGWTCPKHGRKWLRYEGGPCPLDVFVCRGPEQWGYLLTVRTGPTEFAKSYVQQMRTLGFEGKGGFVHALVESEAYGAGEVVAMYEEKDAFDKVGLRWVDPAERSLREGEVLCLAERRWWG